MICSDPPLLVSVVAAYTFGRSIFLFPRSGTPGAADYCRTFERLLSIRPISYHTNYCQTGQNGEAAVILAQKFGGDWCAC